MRSMQCIYGYDLAQIHLSYQKSTLRLSKGLIQKELLKEILLVRRLRMMV